MKANTNYLALDIFVILVILISGCVQQKSLQSGQSDSRNNTSSVTDTETEQQETVSQKDLTQTKGMDNLCSSLHKCFIFCKNNVGLCFDFCKKNPAHELCTVPEAAKPQEWVKDASTQPLPEGASKVRLVLPALLGEIDLKTIGGYGRHPGSHQEGLDHEWISVRKGIPVRSWADGYVAYARLNHENDPTNEYRVIIYYGDGLWGEHMHVAQPLVKEGQNVKAGDPVAYGQVYEYAPNDQFAEFNLADQHRRDGVVYWYKFVKGATLVSPFDYLQEDVILQLTEKWKTDIIDTYVLKGEETFGVVPAPWEPYLTNPILLHREHKGELIGEWYLRSSPFGWDGIPDILVFLSANTKYYKKQHMQGAEDSGGEVIISGDWEADYTKNRIVINTTQGIYYGIFELDESGEQAKLKIEYQQGSYPTGFSEQAVVYTERETISKAEEIHYWQHPEDDPRNW